VDQYLIPVEEIWHLDFTHSESDNFRRGKELREISTYLMILGSYG
jgi:hypothetical protein